MIIQMVPFRPFLAENTANTCLRTGISIGARLRKETEMLLHLRHSDTQNSLTIPTSITRHVPTLETLSSSLITNAWSGTNTMRTTSGRALRISHATDLVPTLQFHVPVRTGSVSWNTKTVRLHPHARTCAGHGEVGDAGGADVARGRVRLAGVAGVGHPRPLGHLRTESTHQDYEQHGKETPQSPSA